MRQIWLLIAIITFSTKLPAPSITYVLRLAEVTHPPLVTEPDHRYHTIFGLLFDALAKKYDRITTHNYLGPLISYTYANDTFCARAFFGAAHITKKVNQVTTFSSTKTDDLLLTVGRTLYTKCRCTGTGSFLLGIPTHAINALRQPDFGYGQVGLGIQLNGAYAIKESLLAYMATRLVHLIPRKALDSNDREYLFTHGNRFDFLGSIRKSYNEHSLELGYSGSASFKFDITPPISQAIPQSGYLHSTIYGIYKYAFVYNDVAHALLINLSCGRSHLRDDLLNRLVIGTWIAWGVNF